VDFLAALYVVSSEPTTYTLRLEIGIESFGETLVLKRVADETTVCVPHWTKAFIEEDAMKARCPECDFVTVFPGVEGRHCGIAPRVDNRALPIDEEPIDEDDESQ
jgi:hypothetical protein